MAYCSQCGKELSKEETFCSNCGTRAEEAITMQYSMTDNEKIMQAVKSAICAQLKSPASAQFPEDLISITGNRETGYHIEGFVDSQNGYGAMIRNDFNADVRVVNGIHQVISSSVATKADVQRAKEFGINYIALSIFTAIGAGILYFITSAVVGF